MIIIVSNWYTDAYPTEEEVESLCKPGRGADTCSWLVVNADGFECTYNHKPYALLKRHEEKSMVALRDGCTWMRSFDNFVCGTQEHSPLNEPPTADQVIAEKVLPAILETVEDDSDEPTLADIARDENNAIDSERIR